LSSCSFSIFTLWRNIQGENWIEAGLISKSHLKKWHEIAPSISVYFKSLQGLSVNISAMHEMIFNTLYEDAKNNSDHQKEIEKHKVDISQRRIHLINQYETKNLNERFGKTTVNNSKELTQLIFDMLVVNSAILESPLHILLQMIITAFPKKYLKETFEGLYDTNELDMNKMISNYTECQKLYSKDSFQLVCLLDEMMQFRLIDKSDCDLQMEYTMEKKEKIKETLDYYLGLKKV
jgi:hypothetical protein